MCNNENKSTKDNEKNTENLKKVYESRKRLNNTQMTCISQ